MSKYTASARGQNCMVRLPGVCNFDPATTVPAHKNGGGMGAKHEDIHIAYACFNCHAWLDGGYALAGASRFERNAIHDAAIIETQTLMIKAGVLVL